MTNPAKDRPPRDALSISLKLVQESQGIVLYLDSQRLMESGIELAPEVLAWAGKSPITSVRHAVKQLQRSINNVSTPSMLTQHAG